MTENRSFKRQVRARMEETGEKYTEARRAILAEREAESVSDSEGEAVNTRPGRRRVVTNVTLYVRRGGETVAAVPLESGRGSHVVVEATRLDLQPGDAIDIAVTYNIRGDGGER